MNKKIETDEERKIKHEKYQKIMICMIVVFVGALIILMISKPKPNPAEEAKIKAVNAQVLTVEKKYVGTTSQKNLRYYLEVKADNQYYSIGPISVASFSAGSEYEMYIYEDQIYTDMKTAKSATMTKHSEIFFRIAVFVAFASAICVIAYVTAFFQTKPIKQSL